MFSSQIHGGSRFASASISSDEGTVAAGSNAIKEDKRIQTKD